MEQQKIIVEKEGETTTNNQKISAKRSAIEYYLLSISTMLLIFVSRQGGIIMFGIFSLVIIATLRLYISIRVEEVNLKNFVLGKNVATYFAAVLMLLIVIKQYISIGASGLTQENLGLLLKNSIVLLVTFVILYMLAVCHEKLYRGILFGAFRKRYPRLKLIWVFLIIFFFEFILIQIDGIGWKPYIICTVLLGIFAIRRCYFSKYNYVYNATTFAFLYCTYWLLLNKFPEALTLK
ncbi:MAG: hypothetical protein WCV63_07800 [Negativicutes bacterium]|jgi:membrane protease YdiL (CAAX protease family)